MRRLAASIVLVMASSMMLSCNYVRIFLMPTLPIVHSSCKKRAKAFGFGPWVCRGRLIEYPIEEQYERYLYGVLCIHHSHSTCTEGLAENGERAVSFLLAKLQDEKDDGIALHIIEVFSLIPEYGHYNLKDNHEAMTALRNRVAAMKIDYYREEGNDHLYKIEKGTFPIERLYKTYLHVSLHAHRPSAPFAKDLAEKGREAVSFLLAELQEAKDDSVVVNIIYVFSLIPEYGHYNLKDNQEAMTALRNRVAAMRIDQYRDKCNEYLSKIEKGMPSP